MIDLRPETFRRANLGVDYNYIKMVIFKMLMLMVLCTISSDLFGF